MNKFNLSQQERSFFEDLHNVLEKHNCTIVKSGNNIDVAFCLHDIQKDFIVEEECNAYDTGSLLAGLETRIKLAIYD